MTLSRRTTAFSVLIGRRTGAPSDRLGLELLGGLGALYDSTKAFGYFDDLGPGGAIASHNAYDTHDTEHFLGAILGFDVSIGLSRHVVLLPQARLLKTVANWRGPDLARVGVALRWRL
jgi:hypothetical protein